MNVLTIISTILVIGYAGALKWIPGDFKLVPKNAVSAGIYRGIYKNINMFVGRAYVEGIWAPAKVWQHDAENSKCYFSLGGSETFCDKYEVLVGDASEYVWKTAIDGEAPKCTTSTADPAVRGSKIGRCKLERGYLVGRINSDYGWIEYPAYKKEGRMKSFDGLVDTKCLTV